MTTKIAVAHGDGIGPEIMEVTLAALRAVGAPLEFVPVEMGASVYARGERTGMTSEARDTVERLGILLKGPMETPKGGGVKSINVTARKLWNTYANKRVFRTLRGVDSVASRGRHPIELTLIRENIEDTYGAVEHMQTHDVAQCRRFITRPGSEQVHRYAFEVALRKGARRVTCVHKANIMKLTDGLFLKTFYEVAADYPTLVADDLIVDDVAMRLVMTPEAFDVVVLPNLQGDILSDLAAGLVGGLGYAPAANIGDHVQIFEAVHGTAPDIVGKDLANPTALLLSASMMLRHLGLLDCASHLENAIETTLLAMRRCPDLGVPPPPIRATRYRELLVAAIEQTKPTEARESQRERMGVSLRTELGRTQPRVMVSPKSGREEIVGVDLFVESSDPPDVLARHLAELSSSALRMTMISNRGTQVWPTGSAFTDCVNHYRVRFEADGPRTAPELLQLAATVSERARLCSLEMLLRVDGERAFSLAQGQ